MSIEALAKKANDHDAGELNSSVFSQVFIYWWNSREQIIKVLLPSIKSGNILILI